MKLIKDRLDSSKEKLNELQKLKEEVYGEIQNKLDTLQSRVDTVDK